MAMPLSWGMRKGALQGRGFFVGAKEKV